VWSWDKNQSRRRCWFAPINYNRFLQHVVHYVFEGQRYTNQFLYSSLTSHRSCLWSQKNSERNLFYPKQWKENHTSRQISESILQNNREKSRFNRIDESNFFVQERDVGMFEDHPKRRFVTPRYISSLNTRRKRCFGDVLVTSLQPIEVMMCCQNIVMFFEEEISRAGKEVF